MTYNVLESVAKLQKKMRLRQLSGKKSIAINTFNTDCDNFRVYNPSNYLWHIEGEKE